MRYSICFVFLACCPCLFAQRVNHQPGQLSQFPTNSVWGDRYSAYAASPSPAVLGNPVSVMQLQIPPRAVKEFERSQKSFDAGNLKGSVDHLEKALAIYPKFAEGHNLLGIRYIQLNKLENALSEFRAATTLNSGFTEAVGNQSLALYLLRRYPEAEFAARLAMNMGSLRESTRFVLGLTLAAQDRYTPETLGLLREARPEFPAARLVLAVLLANRGQSDAAVSELRAYLALPDAPDKAKIACWLAELTNAPSAAACSAK
jgi:tetratricopeptide (TPR) repeat protein